MGWDIDLVKDGEVVEVRPHKTGSNLVAEQDRNGNLVPVDRTEATCCITFNYSKLFRLVGIHGLRETIDGKLASETVEILRSGVEKLGTRQHADYWADTPGNAGHALETLLSWAEEHPDAVWNVT